MLKNLKENKILKIIGNLLYAILFLIVIAILIVVILQRVSDNTIAIGGYRIFTVASGSMEPVYNVGDILIAKEIKPSEIREGDNIVYKGEKESLENKIITHQVVKINQNEDGKYRFITKGIANIKEDPGISENQIYGKIIYKMILLSYIGKLISNIYVFYFLIFVPIALIIYRQIRDLLDTNEDE